MHRSSIALLLAVWTLSTATTAAAQSEGEIIEDLVVRTVDTCVGPRELALEGLEEALDLLAAAPFKSCSKACRTAGKGCLKIVKNEDKCGKVFLKSVTGIAQAVCEDSFCRSNVKRVAQTALAVYVNGGDAERLLCVQDQLACQQVCTP